MINTQAIGIRACRRTDNFKPRVYVDLEVAAMGGPQTLALSSESALALSKALYAAAKFIEDSDHQFKQVVKLVPAS